MVKSIRLFFHGAYFSYIALFAWLRPAFYLSTKVVNPLMYMLFFVLLGKYASGNDNASFYVVGNAMLTVTLSGIYGVSMSVDGDRNGGTLIYLFGTPANRLLLFLGRAFMHILDGILGIVIGFGWGVILFHLNLSRANLPALALIVIVTSLSTSGLGLVLGCLGLMTRNVMFVNNTLFVLLWIFSGANVQLDTLPQWAQTVSSYLPLTRGIVAARTAVAGAGWPELLPLLAGEFFVGLAYALVGFSLFHWFEQQAKRRGTLEAF
ncbi:MAG: ABC transporter permease [Ardenticatenaceae bacterium]|nr:ABC transporter permease [Ardenticatenaceae bacterium]MCB9444945.1 ABC transporter permease [Ardenticatenaceae bacterium]